MSSNQKTILFCLLVLFCLNSLAWYAVYLATQAQTLKVFFFDVGQGSSAFIETPGKTQILVDGGPSAKVLEKLARVMPFFDRQIDLIVSTHPDFDHLAGLVETLKSYQVERVAWTGVLGQTAEFQEFMKEAEKEQAEKIILKRGERIRVGNNLVIDVLAPVEDFEGKAVKDTNSSSLVLRVSYGQEHFLLTGDAPSSVEQKLVEFGDNLQSQVLQVGHHGSKYSTSQAFLEQVEPELAVIQAGKDNRYGHPDPSVLERLKNYGIKVMRSDQSGDIKITSDGRKYELSSF